MLSRAQEKLIRSLHTKKGRRETGLCLVEGRKPIETAGDALEFTFGRKDTAQFEKLATTDTPQELAGVAKIPSWSVEEVERSRTIVVLDGVQDPGNVGAILRLCLGFDASLILIESADPASPKVVRSSVGAMFHVPWIQATRTSAPDLLGSIDRPVFRLEKRKNASDLAAFASTGRAVLIAGSEGSGITLPTKGASIAIRHDKALESLNVGHALAVALHARYEKNA